MAVFSDIDIKYNVNKKGLVINPFNLSQLTGVGYDLTIGCIVDADSENLPKCINGEYELEGGHRYIVITKEYVWFSRSIMGTLHARGSLSLAGLSTTSTTVDPNFRGHMAMCVVNLASSSKGKIMIHLTFDYKTDEKCTTPGQYLKYHRTFQGLSTRELAEKVGIVPATLVLYENDRHPIKYSTAVALANVLGIDRNRLLDEYTAFVDYPYFSLLKKVRQDLSLTQIQMAELIGIGQTSYSGWEREIRVPRRKEYDKDKILAALKKLRVNVDTYLCQSASI